MASLPELLVTPIRKPGSLSTRWLPWWLLGKGVDTFSGGGGVAGGGQGEVQPSHYAETSREGGLYLTAQLKQQAIPWPHYQPHDLGQSLALYVHVVLPMPAFM